LTELTNLTYGFATPFEVFSKPFEASPDQLQANSLLQPGWPGYRASAAGILPGR
jgi:hypothetical protein